MNNIRLWLGTARNRGTDEFIDWFSALFSIDNAHVHNGIVFVNRQCIKNMHSVLNLANLYGVEKQQLFKLLRQVSTEQVWDTLPGLP